MTTIFVQIVMGRTREPNQCNAPLPIRRLRIISSTVLKGVANCKWFLLKVHLAGGVATLCEDGHLFSNPLVWSLRKPASTLSETYDSHLGRNAFKRKKPCCRILTPNCSKYFHSDRTRTRTLSYVAEGLGNLTPNSSLSY